MKIRKKIFFLHTLFSLGLAALFVLMLRPAVREVVDRAESAEAIAILQGLIDAQRSEPLADRAISPSIAVKSGPAVELAIPAEAAARALASPGTAVGMASAGTALVAWPGGERFSVLRAAIPEARDAVTRLYVMTVLALLAAYAMVVILLELFVLPRHVYGPIRRTLEADQAVRTGRRDAELIPDETIGRDELGQIMRSRNGTISALRKKESELAIALNRLEEVANDLKKKNHLLQAARQNLADADRLASLGIMSAGIAHELNTPLAVLKGLVEKLAHQPREGVDPEQAQLMLRVVRRLERLSESLLDFARVRPPVTRPVPVAEMIDEALTLVRLDRGSRSRIERDVPEGLSLACDSDRMVQVLVNIVRNAAEAASERGDRGLVEVRAEPLLRDGREWVVVTIADNGPGIAPQALSRLFEPFASTRLDSRGTGLGLAVAEGIVREHEGVILARNRVDDRGVVRGAIFEIMLPARAESERAEPTHEAAVRA